MCGCWAPVGAQARAGEGVGPEEMETLLTRPVEEAVARVGGEQQLGSKYATTKHKSKDA